MNVKQLKNAIKDLPDDMDIFVGERLTEFQYGLVNGLNVKEISFSEEPDSEILSNEIVLILSEEI